MKNLSLVVLMGALTACGNNGSDVSGAFSGNSAVMLTETGASAPAVPSAPGASAIADSSQFLFNAYQDGQGEIQLSQIALQKSTNGRIKTFAQRMIDHHTALNDEILRMAQSKNITLPNDLSPEQKAEADSLSALPADQFDRAYMQTNVTVHETDVAAFRQQAEQGSDADVKALADRALPILKIHLAAAIDIQSAIDPAAFIAHAYQGGLAEIQLSQLAAQKATSDDVRNFAQRRINDHTQANSQIAALAQQKSVSLPSALSPEHQAALAELAKFSGTDFDKTYMDLNTIEHAKAVRLFRKQARDGMDADVRRLAQSNVPVLEGHLVMAVEIARMIEPSFLYKAYQRGNSEVRLSQLALLKASNNEVRAFAQRMIDDHATTNADLVQIAQQKNVPLPNDMSPEQTLAFVVLMRLKEDDFNEAFMQYNERLHRHAVADFTAQTQQGTDAAIRALAENALPLLNTHLELARETLQRIGAETQ
ncbi:MAG TPA: DUF4142 domain-containing protein [Noviherbaspirillum sp.]